MNQFTIGLGQVRPFLFVELEIYNVQDLNVQNKVRHQSEMRPFVIHFSLSSDDVQPSSSPSPFACLLESEYVHPMVVIQVYTWYLKNMDGCTAVITNVDTLVYNDCDYFQRTHRMCLLIAVPRLTSETVKTKDAQHLVQNSGVLILFNPM